MQAFRLAQGGRVDRLRPISLQFNGKRIEGYAGDTVASALLANGIHFVGRSFKYHRPRGLFSHGCDEPNALLTVDRGGDRKDPNNRASCIEATHGHSLRSQNHWPSLAFDAGAVNDMLSPLFVAGFYYKTFMWPPSFWDRLYEPCIRAAAGLGRAPAMPDPDGYQHAHAHCDVLVVGCGPAGIAAALAASERGKSVLLVDEQAEMGGALLHELTSTIDGTSAWEWLANALRTLRLRENVTLLPRTTAFGYYNQNHIGLVQRLTDHLPQPHPEQPRERLWQVRAVEVVLAAGAQERPLIFPENDRPGIMLAESLRVFVNRYAVLPGRHAIIATCGASAYTVAADLKAAGMAVTIVDLRQEYDCALEAATLRAAGCDVLTGHTIVGSRGRARVTDLIVASIAVSGAVGKPRSLACDCVGLCGGWTPAVHLFSQSGGKSRFDAGLDAFVPGSSAQAECSVGAARGTYRLCACLDEGWAAGEAAGGGAAGPMQLRAFRTSETRTGFRPVRIMPGCSNRRRSRAFVDLQNDVTAEDIGLAVSEGFEAIEHVKRYTTTGMATDQGKTSSMNALGLVAEILHKPVPEVGTTTFRLPYTPVTFGAFAGPSQGRLFDPVRTTPTHRWALAQGAVFEDVGLWKRARYFSSHGKDLHAAVARECRAVRAGIGLFDGSTLGKIEIVGPDAAEFLNRIYVNDITRLAPGRCRYALLLKEDGCILDDGIVARLTPDRFHVTTTTGGAMRVLQHMEDYLQTEWPGLRVYLTSITEQFAVIALQGPHARHVLAPLVERIDLSNDVCPHMSVRVGAVCGIPCRLFRISFTGELGYEINVPSDYGQAVWTALLERGNAFGITAYGTEAMHVLRAEKGFIIVGQETDGTVTPDDVGLAGLIGKSKVDFVGRRSLLRTDIASPRRKQLVGLKTNTALTVLEEGAQIVADTAQPIPMRMLGHVTSSYWSSTCECSIALALVEAGRTLMGQRLYATTPTGFSQVEVCAPVFYDAKGVRVHG
jgi:sarcosine oxidase subunit alpha